MQPMTVDTKRAMACIRLRPYEKIEILDLFRIYKRVKIGSLSSINFLFPGFAPGLAAASI